MLLIEQERNRRYVEGLELFLEQSSEDEVDVAGILGQLPIHASACAAAIYRRRSARVLDVGAGNGAKAVQLARRLSELGVEVVVDSIEPKAEQRERLAATYQGTTSRFRGSVFEEPLGSVKGLGTYDLVLVIHSLYEFPRREDGTLLSLDRLPPSLADDGAAVIVVEHPDGDFQRMKRELYPGFGMSAPVSLGTITNTLQRADTPFTVGDTIDFGFDLTPIIGQPDLAIGRSLSFLFSDSLIEERIGDAEFGRIGAWMRTAARRQGTRYYLSTPDIAVWVHPKR